MDERLEISDGLDILNIKTGINLYRSFTFVLLVLSIICCFLFSIFNRDIAEIIGSLLLSFIFFLLTVFMDKLVYVLNLPTNHLLVSKKEIVYKTNKKQLVFKANEISYDFHSFFENFESISRLRIVSSEKEYYISITKKQFDLINDILSNR